jgi:hypothetical protein
LKIKPHAGLVLIRRKLFLHEKAKSSPFFAGNFVGIAVGAGMQYD